MKRLKQFLKHYEIYQQDNTPTFQRFCWFSFIIFYYFCVFSLMYGGEEMQNKKKIFLRSDELINRSHKLLFIYMRERKREMIVNVYHIVGVYIIPVAPFLT